MKPQSKIVGRARSLVETELFRRLQEAGQRLPRKCVHNHRHSLDSRPTVDGDPNPTYNRVNAEGGHTIGLCMLGADNPEEWSGTVCEDPIDAQRCPYFTPLQDKATVLREFASQLADSVWVSENMPLLWELLWILDMVRPPQLSWWARLKVVFTRIRVEPAKIVVDPVLLLGKPDETDHS